MLRELNAGQLWTVDEPHQMLGLEVGARMTIVRLGDGGLWVYAPFEIPEAEVAAIEGLGSLRYLVVPSPYHATEAAAFAARFPEAELWTIPEAVSRLQAVSRRTLYQVPEEWGAELDGLRFDAGPFMREWVFCHRATRTLMVTDLCLNLPMPSSPPQRLIAQLAGVGHFGPSRLEWSSLRFALLSYDRARYQIEKILSWDFDRVIVTHGPILETGGKDALRRAFAWLLPSAA